MNAKGKNYNSIVFLTTLSVYLGLVLVGSTPQALAQNSKKSAEPNKISIFVPSQGAIFTFDLNPIIELNRLAAKESLPIKMSGKLIPLQQKITNWEIITATGNQKVIDFLRKEFFTPMVIDPPTLPSITKEEFQLIEIDKDNITFTRKATSNSVREATEIANIFNQMVEYAKSPKADKEIAGNLYLTNTQARSENNQVFIVTRLPRGSLNALLTKNAQ